MTGRIVRRPDGSYAVEGLTKEQAEHIEADRRKAKAARRLDRWLDDRDWKPARWW